MEDLRAALPAMLRPKPCITRKNWRAAANLVKAIPELAVQGYFVDFDGIWEAEIGTTEIRQNESVA